MFVQFALLAAQMYLSIVTQKRPHKFTFEEFLEQNKGDETRPIPYIRGKWKTTPQRIWLGDFSARAVERDSVWTDYLFFGVGFAALLDFITVNYTYYIGQALALTWGPINRVSQVYVDDLACAVPPATDNAGGSLLLDFPTAFGGDQPPGQGGIYGICDVLPGTYTQPVNPYLAGIIGTIPALRGVACLVVRGRTGLDNYGYFAASQPTLRNWQVEVMAWPDNFGTGFHRLPDDSYNRVDVLYEWTTKADYGAEYPIENIHLASWLEAQETIYDEGNGFSGEINTGGNVGEVVAEIKASMDAEVFEHPSDGLKIKLIRKDYSIPSLTTFDQSNVNSVEEYTPGDYADTYNKVILNYINEENNYQPRPAIYEDPANWHIQRRVASRELTYPGVTNADTAQELVTRDGRMLGQPWPPLVIQAGEAGRSLWPGDVFKFEWPNPLLSKIFRVGSRTPSVSFNGEKNFKLVSTEDQYSTGLAAFGSPSDSGHVNPAGTFDDTPPSATWDAVGYPPDGLIKQSILADEMLTKTIVGGIIFGTHAVGQYARIYVTEPGGVQTLSPIRLAPDGDNKAFFLWPVGASDGVYEFCVETYSINNVTNGIKVCASISVLGSSPSASVSPSVSASTSPSVSPSASASPSAGFSPSGSASPSASGSPSVSTSPSVSPSSSASPSDSGTDPYIDNVVLLAHMDGVDGSTTFTDERSHTLTAVNQAQIDTAQSKFGGASGLFDGTDYVSSPDSADWYFGSGLWTMEGWFRWDTDQAAFQYLLGQWNPVNSGNLRSWTIVRDGVNAPKFLQLRLSANGATNTIKISATWSPALSTWYHIAADWDGTTYRLYVDGVVIGSATTGIALFDSTGLLAIASGFIGWVDDVRITKGVARYAGAFTPPTSAFPNS